jgi:catechol 2,3-dioxygenase-like lactoylglutathione lyase family enzyme
VSRRRALLSLTALVAPRLAAQTARPTIRVRGINHVTLAVADVKRSVDFYQGLFGMPVISRQGIATNLQIGTGPQYLGVTAAGASPPRIDHLCLGVEDFDVERVTGILAQHGVTRAESAAGGSNGLSGGPMRMRVRVRGPDAGGAKAGTPELYVGDPNGFVIQLQDWRYCGGAGTLGNVCSAPVPPPQRGLLAVRGWNHCTNGVSDPLLSRKFVQDVFGLGIQAYQGPTAPVFGVGGRGEFLMFNTGGAGRGGSVSAPRAGINHLCVTVESFRPEAVIKALESYGIKPRDTAAGAPGPLVHYISMRRDDRGGAKEGTPELYFTDPDGLQIQLQDVSYCGGAGVLGNVCS